MDKQLGKEYPQDARIQFLKDNADKVEKKTYMRRFTPDELRQKKDQLAETSIALSEIDDEKKTVLQEIKQREEPLKSEKKILLSNIKHKAEEVKEECYKFIDQENNEVGFYNSEGDLIEQRPAYPDERQGTIFQISRTGTDN
jgi:outer membrane biosynthesis protein TonB